MKQIKINILLKLKIRIIIYTLVFISLLGYNISRFVFNEPIDVLTNYGKLIYEPSLSHEAIILMIGRGVIMYSILLICVFTIIEGILKFTVNYKNLFKIFAILFALLAILEMYWERNYLSLINLISN